ncbi:MAG: YkgJ family cysteine cluster protein [Planctomycetota bacterium]|nr:MAG: YkgJ family cysteine cluster protein [Planctomycetota bacterium]REJ93486.1 MAG: YkgJ family cysteine cluster protein [Planctomycetota bacterium]REK23201.1 MAG: YkgJ family cysteine cluster protein [Planctomycetota bacterium]REK30880.1 MAG: YkgJ family cysteine cluster protein [Planctomycetota bacterium]
MSDNRRGDRWYKKGLCFSCTQCGNCCTGAPGYVWVDAEAISQIAEYLGVSTGEVRLLHTRPVGKRVSLNEYANGDCTFFDPRTRKCRIYPVRPVQCQTWPFWGSNLESRESWEETGKTCPGIGTGEVIGVEEIELLSSRFS